MKMASDRSKREESERQRRLQLQVRWSFKFYLVSLPLFYFQNYILYFFRNTRNLDLDKDFSTKSLIFSTKDFWLREIVRMPPTPFLLL